MNTRLGCRSFPAQAEDLHRIRTYIREEGARASLAPEVVGDLVMAVSEACANSALYTDSSEVRVQLEVVDDRVEVAVEDEGVFMPRLPLPGIDGRGGRGIALMMALMDEVSIREGKDDAPGTLVRLVKYAA
jgi:anti-sigma regulatory factor (Ser/Thr protein kinase)